MSEKLTVEEIKKLKAQKAKKLISTQTIKK
jgi:hypothetical protein